MNSISYDIDDALDQIKTSELVKELKFRRQLLSGRDHKAAEKEQIKDRRRSKYSIEVDVDEDELINDMWDGDLLDECKSRNLIQNEINESKEAIMDSFRELDSYNLKRALARLTELPYTATKEQIINALSEKI